MARALLPLLLALPLLCNRDAFVGPRGRGGQGAVEARDGFLRATALAPAKVRKKKQSECEKTNTWNRAFPPNKSQKEV